MIYIFSCILYALFGLIGIFLLKRINFTKNIFNKKQNIIYLSIFYLVFGFFIGKYDEGNTGIAFQIGYGIGNYAVCFAGAVIATFFGMRFKFSFNNELFYYALSGAILFGTILLIITFF
jgi:hypothetical protein